MKKWIRKKILRSVLSKKECTAIKTLSDIYIGVLDNNNDGTKETKEIRKVLVDVKEKF